MKIGEVCLLTNDVIRLSNFYKMLFNVDNHCDDDVHQFIFPKKRRSLSITTEYSEKPIFKIFVLHSR